jgi:hypothetical protein
VKPLWSTHLQHIIKQKLSVASSPPVKALTEKSTSTKQQTTKQTTSTAPTEISNNETNKQKSETHTKVIHSASDLDVAKKSERQRRRHSVKTTSSRHYSSSSIIGIPSERAITILDFDPREVARQLSLIGISPISYSYKHTHNHVIYNSTILRSCF